MASSPLSPLRGIFRLPDPAQGNSRCDQPVSPLPSCGAGRDGAAAPPSIACQHSPASEGSAKLSKKSALIQYTLSHKGLAPFHVFSTRIACGLVQLCSVLCVGMVTECLHYLLSVALLNLKGLLMMCNVKAACQSSQGQELGQFRRAAHCRSPLC